MHTSALHIEPLEARIAPATLFGVTSADRLIRFDSATPGSAIAVGPITGLAAGETIQGIDFRPDTIELYALGSGSRLYTINTDTAVATQVGDDGAFAVTGATSGFDFNPVSNRIRIVSETDQNLRLNANTGALLATDGPLVYAGSDPNVGQNPNVTAAAYTNSFAGATGTTLFDIDTALDVLVTQNPPNDGTLNTVGALGVNAQHVNGFDIQFQGGMNTAFAALTLDGVSSGLYSINLATGAATLTGAIGSTGTLLRGLAVAPEGFVATVLNGTGTFLGGFGNDTLIIDSAGGLLRHNRFTAGDNGFNSAFDFDSTLAGDQTLSATPGSSALLIDGGAGNDTITISESSVVALVEVGRGVDAVGGADGLITARTVTFPDADGDRATLLVSKGTLGVRDLTVEPQGKGVRLVTLDLGDDGSEFANARVRLTALPSAAGGDNHVNIDFIRAFGVDLQSVVVRGDLGRITAGDADASVAGLGILTVRSLGLFDGITGTSTISGQLGLLNVKTDVDSSNIQAGSFRQVQIGGEISDSSLAAETTINTVRIGDGMSNTTLSAAGTLNPASTAQSIAIKAVVVSGSVHDSQILAGYDAAATPVNPAVQIGRVVVGGNWIASDLVAGVQASNGDFGDADDTVIPGAGISRIASIIVGGVVYGTSAGGDHFGFVAHEIGAFRVGNAPRTFAAGGPLDVFEVGGTGDVTVREI